ncbi:MAG TPA: ATP-binding protein, partial [Verrucomicrobiae bacterium]|nr:ATP-binding protein [Verrucomicrobiae bacterium]
MSTRLVSLDFSRELARLTQGFTGREWLVDKLARIIAGQPEQIILLTGEPGIGKSSLAARLLTVRQDVAARHFCVARRIDTITPGTVIRSLATQLSAALPAFNIALLESIKPWQVELNVHIQIKNPAPGTTTTGVLIQNISATNPDEELELLLRAPLATMKASARNVVIVIDALDEALSYRGTPNLVELLAKLGGLPSWLTLFCTSRRSDAVLGHLQPLQPFVLDAGSPENLADVRAYVEKRVSDPSIIARLQQSGIDTETLIEGVTQRAAGNFLYAVIVLDDMATGRLRLEKFEELPQGLDAVYAGFLRRFSDEDWQSMFQPILGKLAVAQEPLTEDQLAAFTGMTPSKVRNALGILDQYLIFSEIGGAAVSFELFHESLREFLRAPNRAGRYWCNPAEEHGAIADYYLTELKAKGVSSDPYLIRHLPLHLAQAGRSEALIGQLSDYTWLKNKLENMTVYELLADFRLAPPQTPITEIESILRLSTFALERDAGQFWNQFHSRSLSAPQPLLQKYPKRPEIPWLRLRRPSLRQFGDPLKWV